MYTSCVRVDRMADDAHLAAQERHGRGEGATAKRSRRPDAGPRALAYVRDPGRARRLGGGVDSDQGFAICEARQALIADYGAKPRNGRAVHSVNVQVKVDREWMLLGGDPHDPDNPRIQQLLETATAWATAKLGCHMPECVFAARYDLDETGDSLVDLYVLPLNRTRNGRRVYFAWNRALANVQAEHRHAKTNFAALQDSWAEWATEHLGAPFARGEPKRTRGPDWRPRRSTPTTSWRSRSRRGRRNWSPTGCPTCGARRGR